MSSDRFDGFLKQLNALGREKGEGFDPSHFEGLSPDERLEAARILREALLEGDNTAAHGLVLLDPQVARPILDEALQKYSGDAWFSLRVVKELWSLTRESRYQDLMIATLQHQDELLRQSALVGLEDTPHNERLMTALETLVRDDPVKRIRLMAAAHLLYGMGLITDIHSSVGLASRTAARNSSTVNGGCVLPSR